MLSQIARFEFRYQIRNPIFWIVIVVFGLLVFAGTLSPNSFGAGPNVLKNAPYKVAQVYMLFSVLYMIVSVAFVANAVVRDDETGFGPILRATRMSKTQYLFGRYAGAVLAAALGFLVVPAALWFGTLMPWLDPSRFEPNRLSAYLEPYLCLALPNLLVTSALLFSLATITRSAMATYVGVVTLAIVWSAATNAEFNHPGTLVACIDPFGFSTVAYMTRYWTMDELNHLGTPMYGPLLWNRIAWIAVAGAFFALAHARFRFGTRASRAARRRSADAQALEPIAIAGTRAAVADPHFDHATAWAQLRARARLDMAQIFRSPAYAALLALGLFSSVMGLRDLHPMWGTPSLPVTRLMIQLLNENFELIPLIIAIYYSGELVWRERDRNMQEIIGATPIADWAYVVPKTLALALVLISTLLVGMVAAIAIQVVHGYTDFEIGRYLLWYLLPNTVDYVLIASLAVFVQAISPHKFIGWGILLLFVISRSLLPYLSLDDHLWTYAQGPAVPLSDMNGQGQFWIGAWSFRAYWSALALLLLVLSHALWRRGAETRLMSRLKRLPQRLQGPAGGVATVAILTFAGLGIWCFTNTHVWNTYLSARDEERYLSDYEKQLLPYEKVLQPSVTMVRVKADLWPHQHRLVASGTLDLVNRQAVPLSEVHIRLFTQDAKWTKLAVSGATLARDYPAFRYRIYRFVHPLAPGAVAHVAFTTVHQQIGFRNDGNDVHVVDNGTFIDSPQMLPIIGMNRIGLLQDPIKRRKYGLPSELRFAEVEDMSATKSNELHSDWVRTDITLSTDADQTPIAPGTKVADRTSNGRRTARFVISTPTQNFFSIQSGQYQERHVQHEGVDLAVYYDAQHAQNVDRMLIASAHALDIYRSAFGPYPFDYTRIVEFPTYRTFAQSFAGTFPYSEGLGFIADLRDPSMIDYTGQVVAHELAHQWWGHQAIGADMQGDRMLDETLAQYSSLMVMEKVAGRDQVRRYLQHELDTYLASRGSDAIGELPLARVENQPYIEYQKGALVMYRLRYVLGEERVNAALRRYLARFRYRSAPYPRSLDLIAEFRKGASPAENRLITDLFEKIALYDVRAKAAKVRKLPDGRYETLLTVEAHKYYADGRGKESETPLAEPIGFALYAAMPGWGPLAAKDLLTQQFVAVHSGVQQIRLISAAKPSFAGTDPYDILIDRHSDDNVVATVG